MPATAKPPAAETLHITEVAALLGCSTYTVRERVKDGKFPGPLPLGRLPRWSAAVVREWIESNGAMSPAKAKR